ncbi:biotin transporter BioY [Alkalicoccus daliensis]|uniref:Biotin transporter n=1 Tax=Alkalicoccus daliensis TaxID=745820 RepID=A0A1H0JHD1_9BACI|nr:biotin transporter BioY [Alkalicoccus daliensis]SDO42992.1 biotin transport system substrate-specific component [Alkalicoccus daliensis]
MKKTFISTSELTYAAMFIALMAVGANMAAIVTIGSVPLTFQTVVAVLAGVTLGKKVGTFSMLGYILLGFTGAPVFAGFSNGFAAIASPTFGFIISFLFIAFFSGLILEKTNNKTKSAFFAAGFVGLLFNYGIGVPYVYFYTFFILGVTDASITAISLGMVPFFIKDTILVFLAASLAAQLHARRIIRPSLQKAV